MRALPSLFRRALGAAALIAPCLGCDPPSAPPAPVTSAAPAESALVASSTEATASAVGPLASAVGPTAEAPTIVGAAHIMIAYKGSLAAPKTVTRSKAEAKARAEEARKKLVDKRASFEDLVKEYSDDPLSKPVAGMIGNFERGVMPQAFSDATFGMPVGEISEVVETPRGFHVIRRTK